MFRSLLYDHPQGLSFVLSAFATFPLLASSCTFSVCGRMPSMCMCVQCTCLWVVWSFTTRQPQPTDRYSARKPTRQVVTLPNIDCTHTNLHKKTM
jgi:hypothetical protein